MNFRDFLRNGEEAQETPTVAEETPSVEADAVDTADAEPAEMDSSEDSDE